LRRFFDPGDVFAATGVDLDQLPFFDKGGNTEGVTAFDGGRLAVAGGGVAFDPGIGLYNAEVDEVRQGDADRAAVEHEDFDLHVVAQEELVVAEGLFREMGLLEGLVIHEDVAGFVLIEILHADVFELGRLEGIPGTIGAVEEGAGDHVAQLALVDRLPLPRLGKVKTGDDVRFAVDEELEAFFQIGT
jgi:hypothetical protein